MRNIDYNEFLICRMVGDLFEMSITRSNLSSPLFIKRFMNNEEINSQFYSKVYLFISTSREQIIDEMNEIFKPSKNKYTYSNDEMYWIGYIYSCIAFLYEIPYKKVYELFNAREIRRYYPCYHTFGIEQAAERMMENIGYVKEEIDVKVEAKDEKTIKISEEAKRLKERAMEIMRRMMKEEREEKENRRNVSKITEEKRVNKPKKYE